MPLQIFINLPVADLPKSTAFYIGLGATRNPQFSDDNASCMVLSDSISVMLLTHGHWAKFTRKPIVDAHRAGEVILALSADSQAAVDRITDAAGAHGGRADVNAKQDLGFMYGRSFADPDGHVWESIYMDMAQFQKAANG